MLKPIVLRPTFATEESTRRQRRHASDEPHDAANLRRKKNEPDNQRGLHTGWLSSQRPQHQTEPPASRCSAQDLTRITPFKDLIRRRWLKIRDRSVAAPLAALETGRTALRPFGTIPQRQSHQTQAGCAGSPAPKPVVAYHLLVQPIPAMPAAISHTPSVTRFCIR